MWLFIILTKCDILHIIVTCANFIWPHHGGFVYISITKHVSNVLCQDTCNGYDVTWQWDHCCTRLIIDQNTTMQCVNVLFADQVVRGQRRLAEAKRPWCFRKWNKNTILYPIFSTETLRNSRENSDLRSADSSYFNSRGNFFSKG